MGCHPLGDSTWQVLYLAAENPCLAAVSPAFMQTGLGNAPLVRAPFWYCSCMVLPDQCYKWLWSRS